MNMYMNMYIYLCACVRACVCVIECIEGHEGLDMYIQDRDAISYSCD